MLIKVVDWIEEINLKSESYKMQRCVEADFELRQYICAKCLNIAWLCNRVGSTHDGKYYRNCLQNIIKPTYKLCAKVITDRLNNS